MKTIYFFIAALLGATIAQAQLTSISPTQGAIGQTLQTTITGSGLFIQNSSPSGNISSIKLINGPNVIQGFDYFNSWINPTTVLNADSVISEISIPLTAVSGNYDLEVKTVNAPAPPWTETTHTLPAAFNVPPPDGYISGKVFHDLNANGIYDSGEPGLPNYIVKVSPLNLNIFTDATGNYSLPALNGNYSLIVTFYASNLLFLTSSNDTLSVTINNANSTGNDFGLEPALVSITPSVAYKGIASIHQIVSKYPIFLPTGNPNGNVTNVFVNTSTFPAPLNANAANITYIDSFTVRVIFNPPTTGSAQFNLDLKVTTPSAIHYLNDVFDLEYPPFYITGTAFFDLNQNKIKDPSDPKLNLARFELLPDLTIAYSDTAGAFSFGSTNGLRELVPSNNLPGLTLFTDSSSYSLNVTGNISGKDFGYISSLPDYSIDVKDLYLFPRCNTPQNIKFVVENTSNTPCDVIAWLITNSNMDYISSNIPPSSISNDTIYWTLSNLIPYQSVTITARHLMPPGFATVFFTAGANSYNAGGTLQFSDQEYWTQTAICAFDPNDKSVTPPGILAENFTLMGDTLEYLIRFQNTGNDTAFNVVILDTLDNNLNFSTFELLDASHSLQTEIKNDGAIKFSFLNILLVDSVANEPESHGYIRYRIRGNSGLADSTEINNTAYIYFDYNTAIITNTTLNTFVFVLPTGISEIANKDNVFIYPNPLSESATMTFNNPAADEFSLQISDITGKSVSLPKYTTSAEFIIDGSQLPKGMYIYKLTNSRTKSVSAGKFVVN
ncbi:MAG: T9SS type A sorting domain-containing protein [Bacteroidetes bacterium]|nr:T9SS type A sorting domain-containing protein [Bacteroidota bacterium]